MKQPYTSPTQDLTIVERHLHNTRIHIAAMDKQLDLATSSIKAVLETLSTDSSLSSIGDKKKTSAATGGLSLLDLKNEALLSYLHNSVLVLLGKLERSCNADIDTKKLEELEQKAVRNTVTQRVVLEKGVRGLESKVSYQVEKALRAYAKSKAEAEDKEKKLAEKENDEDDEDDEEDGDLLMFKPNPKLLLNNNNKPAAADKPKSKHHRGSDSEDDDEPKASTEKYQVPKISAVSQQQAHPDAGPNTRGQQAPGQERAYGGLPRGHLSNPCGGAVDWQYHSRSRPRWHQVCSRSPQGKGDSRLRRNQLYKTYQYSKEGTKQQKEERTTRFQQRFVFWRGLGVLQQVQRRFGHKEETVRRCRICLGQDQEAETLGGYYMRFVYYFFLSLLISIYHL